MRFSTIAIAAAVPAFVAATNITVNVGVNGTLAYDPPSLNASLGDMVTFVFQSKNHSVFESTFADPCTNNGFTSPFFAVNGSTAGFESFTINVTQTAPIWFYCAQTTPANHCKAGMVGVINPTADKTLAQFQAAATGNSTNSTSGGNSSSTTNPKPNGAVRMGSGAALLTFVSVVAGITAF